MDENKMTQAGERLLTVDNLKTTFMIHKTKVARSQYPCG